VQEHQRVAIDTYTDRHRDILIDKQTQTDRQTDRQTVSLPPPFRVKIQI